MDKQFALFISYIFHPLVLPIYTVLLFGHTNSEFAIYIAPENILKLGSIFAGISFVAPLTYILFLKSMGSVNDLSDPDKRSRIRISLVVLVFYLITYFLFKRIPLNDIYFDLGIGVVLSIVLATVISFWYKISMHGMAIGGLLGAQFTLFVIHNYIRMDLLIFLILLTGLVGTSRVILKAHTNAQVYLGTVLGMMVVGVYLFIATGY